jgi:hypothetical protein
MGATFQTLSGGSPLAVALNLAKSIIPTQGDCLYAAERQRARIITRTGRGVNVNGQTFEPYSPAYETRKVKTGRDSGIVDLNYSGRMLKALVSQSGGREISGSPRSVSPAEGATPASQFTIGIYGDEAVRASAINAGEGHEPERHFIGASNSDERTMLQDLLAHLRARINGGPLSG